jgi:hypothetical protein
VLQTLPLLQTNADTAEHWLSSRALHVSSVGEWYASWGEPLVRLEVKMTNQDGGVLVTG